MVILHCHLSEIIEAKHKDLSINALSKAVGFRRDTITDLLNNHEMDKRRIPAQLIANLCEYFNITPNELFSLKKV
jgi:DNA-binding Xre family transcriptional regulator